MGCSYRQFLDDAGCTLNCGCLESEHGLFALDEDTQMSVELFLKRKVAGVYKKRSLRIGYCVRREQRVLVDSCRKSGSRSL